MSRQNNRPAAAPAPAAATASAPAAAAATTTTSEATTPAAAVDPNALVSIVAIHTLKWAGKMRVPGDVLENVPRFTADELIKNGAAMDFADLPVVDEAVETEAVAE